MNDTTPLFPAPGNTPNPNHDSTAENSTVTLSTLLQSRGRWRSLARNAVDLIFETDLRGRLVMLSATQWLGRPATAMLGLPVNILWKEETAQDDFLNISQRPVITFDMLGQTHQALLSCRPFNNMQGDCIGYAGTLTLIPPDIPTPIADGIIELPSYTGQSHALDEVLEAMRGAILPHLAANAAVDALASLLDCQAILLSEGDLRRYKPDATSRRLMPVTQPAELPVEIAMFLENDITGDNQKNACFRRKSSQILVVQERIRSRGRIGILLWRENAWTAEDVQATTHICKTLAAHLELDGLHRRILEKAPFDITTGLLNWQGLREQILRRILRLDQENLPATLMVLRVEGLNKIAQSRGLAVDEEALKQTVDLLTKAVRPSDPIGRLGNNLFAIWLDSADRFAAAERAERITSHGVPIMVDPPIHLTAQIGLVCREPGMTDTPEAFFERALQALNEVENEFKLWRFSYEAP